MTTMEDSLSPDSKTIFLLFLKWCKLSFVWWLFWVNLLVILRKYAWTFSLSIKQWWRSYFKPFKLRLRADKFRTGTVLEVKGTSNVGVLDFFNLNNFFFSWTTPEYLNNAKNRCWISNWFYKISHSWLKKDGWKRTNYTWLTVSRT